MVKASRKIAKSTTERVIKVNIKNATYAAVTCAAFVAGIGANAQMIGNMPQTNDTNTSADIDNLRHKALGFIMGNDPYSLKNVEVRVGDYLTFGQLNLEIWSDSGAANPGVMLHQLVQAPPTGPGFATATFLVNGSFIFNSGTQYWLRMSGILGVGPSWRGSSPVITPTGPGATHVGSLFTSNGGTTWTNSATLNSYRINANLVPEPATFAVLGLGVGVILLRRRRR